METTKEVAKRAQQQVGALADVQEMFEDMDFSESESKDLLIPKILLMQGSSDRVKIDATHKAGDIIKSTDGKLLGCAREKDAKPVRFIPIFMYKTWVKKEVLGKGKLQYIETTPVTPENTDQKWEQVEVIDGVEHTYKLTKNINFYVILEEDFGNPLAVPHVLTYRSTSSKAASLLLNWFSECNVAKKAKVMVDINTKQLMLPFAKVFELGGKTESNDEHTWFVFKTSEVEGIKDPKDERLAQLYNWYKVVSQYDHVKSVDNSDDATPVSGESEQVKF